jgi:hypothetical protein
MSKNIILLFLCISLCSCGVSNRQDTAVSLSDISGETKLTDLYGEFEYISPETSDESIFGSIHKLIVYDNKYFILRTPDLRGNQDDTIVLAKQGHSYFLCL